MEKIITGIVIRSIDYSENSKIITVITEAKVLSFILRGAKKYNSSFKKIKDNIKEVTIKYNDTNKDLHYIIEGELLEDFSHIKKDIFKYEMVFVFIKQLNKIQILRTSYSKEMYHIFRKCLYLLENVETKEEVLVVKNLFLLKMLFFLGINPNFKNCYICDNNQIFGLHLSGAVCKTHFNNESLNKEIYDKIYYLYKYKFEEKLLKIDIDFLLLIDDFMEKYYNIY